MSKNLKYKIQSADFFLVFVFFTYLFKIFLTCLLLISEFLIFRFLKFGLRWSFYYFSWIICNQVVSVFAYLFWVWNLLKNLDRHGFCKSIFLRKIAVFNQYQTIYYYFLLSVNIYMVCNIICSFPLCYWLSNRLLLYLCILIFNFRIFIFI